MGRGPNLVLLGPPGAGKGTQATHLRRVWGVPHISTGAMLRDAIKAQTTLGLQVEAIIAAGGLIADDLITGIVRERLTEGDCRDGYLLDGFPRTIAQAESLDAFEASSRPSIVLEIAVPDDDILRRLASRVVCAECGTNAHEEHGEDATCHDCGGPLVARADDEEQVVRHRLQVYRSQTAPLIEFYQSRPTFCRVDGAQLFDRVAEDIAEAIRRVNRVA